MMRERKRVLFSWSSGKESAWALHLLRQQSDVELAGLLTTPISTGRNQLIFRGEFPQFYWEI